MVDTDQVLGLPQFSSVQSSCSVVSNFLQPWTAARQASLSITNSQSLLKFMSIKSVMPSNHLTLCHPLLLPPPIFPSVRVFSNESVAKGPNPQPVPWPHCLRQDLNLSLVWWVPSAKVFASSLDILSLNPGGGICCFCFLFLCSFVSSLSPFS